MSKEYPVNLKQILAIHSKVSPGRDNRGGNEFPGAQFGMTVEQVRNFVSLQKRVQGYNIQTQQDTTITTNIQLSGVAKFFLGINITMKSRGDGMPDAMSNHTASLILNNEQIFTNLNAQFLNPLSNNMRAHEFFPFPRPVTGNDQFQLSFDSKQADLLYVALYYL